MITNRNDPNYNQDIIDAYLLAHYGIQQEASNKFVGWWKEGLEKMGIPLVPVDYKKVIDHWIYGLNLKIRYID
jgi:hypothetical protein